MPAWQLVHKPLNHTLMLQNYSHKEHPWKSVRELRGRQVGSGEEDGAISGGVRRSDKKTFTPWGEYLTEYPSASLVLCFFAFEMSSWPHLSFLELRL